MLGYGFDFGVKNYKFSSVLGVCRKKISISEKPQKIVDIVVKDFLSTPSDCQKKFYFQKPTKYNSNFVKHNSNFFANLNFLLF